MMVSASPTMKPLSTDSEMKFAINPSRVSPAASMVSRGPGEFGDEDAVGVRSGTMILIHLDRVEHAYGKSRSASSSPGQAMDIGRE
jgi:hypothetical protein